MSALFCVVHTGVFVLFQEERLDYARCAVASRDWSWDGSQLAGGDSQLIGGELRHMLSLSPPVNCKPGVGCT